MESIECTRESARGDGGRPRFLRLNVHHANFDPFRHPVVDERGAAPEGLSHFVVVNCDDIVCAGIPEPDGGSFLHVFLRDGKHLVCWGGIDQFDPIESVADEG